MVYLHIVNRFQDKNLYYMQVEIKDETSLKVITNRGEKEFEFDSVFSATSTQVCKNITHT